jgi:periplasmic copper chaperone A
MLRYLPVWALLLVATITSPAVVQAHEYEGKAVTVVHPWARATPGGSTIGAAYVEFSGLETASGDKLIGASTPAAGRVEIHTHTMADGVMKMRKVDEVAVAAGETKKLNPGGDHLMLFDLKAPLKDGELLPLTLKFATSGDITVEAAIGSVGAMGPHESPASASADAKAAREESEAGSDAGSHDGH